MRLTRAQIINGAYDALGERGLNGLSMRRLAQDLGVQPGALYYHVANKQELLAAVATRIFEETPIPTTEPRAAVAGLREALLRVRDGAEIVSFVQAFQPDTLAPARELRRLFAHRFRDREATWAAHTVMHYVLGFVAEEQNRAELVRARILDDQDATDPAEAFAFGMEAILTGLETLMPRENPAT